MCDNRHRDYSNTSYTNHQEISVNNGDSCYMECLSNTMAGIIPLGDFLTFKGDTLYQRLLFAVLPVY